MERFSINVAEDVLLDLSRRLDATRWPDDGPAGYGLTDAMELAAYWREEYDWRVAEDVLNGFEQYVVDGMHCIVEGDGPPLLLLHGWPSTVWEFNRVIADLREHFRVVVPSLPGYGWSVGLGRAGTAEMADAMHALMGALGHREYLVAGGDWGAHIGCRMAYAFPDAVRALHLNMMPLRKTESYPEHAAKAREELAHWSQEEGGYIQIMGTKPQTLTYGLFDSPVGLMTWIAEKFDSWTDELGVPRDDVLTTTMIYWITGSIGTSFWPYHARLHGGFALDQVVAAGEKITVPMTYLDFPREMIHVPREVAELAFANIERWETPDYGGHFPALEVPDVLVDSLRRFSR
ncbi:epoxide hydrolase [Solirubrobacter phytolaccae]|uniref:Epoxide hydrolase n=1 Tax=Solirubrobacter phytolaccae TaxID=1404360 RepID=A0A9X3NMK1_9ACTN|nr:epoxide hydrolase family protein [Solirubrobacter phytolaccae]MDA0184197.1 epoxide hydrolase [Solirubrobacter phytolaccae]